MADEGNHPARKRKRTDRNDPDATKIAQKSPKKTATCDQKGMDMRTKLREKFKVEFPQDFFDFWELCKKLSSASPTEAFSSPLGLKLVGPYDVLSGRSDDVDDADITSYHLHWRYYYDPPEFLTVIKGDDDTGYHMGYYRDDPKSLSVFVASNQAQKSCEFAVLGENLFAAINQFIGDFMKTSKSKQKSLKALQSSLTSEAKELKYSLETSTPAVKARKKNVVSKTFHKAGIVVPVDSNDVGYRPLTVTDGELKKILQRITEGKNEKEREQASDDLQEIMTLIQFANDECDYGMGLELGVDLLCFGSERFHKTILQLMPLAYRLLGRDEFAEIVEVHVNHRCRASLSQLPS